MLVAFIHFGIMFMVLIAKKMQIEIEIVRAPVTRSIIQ
jgi:hypothetical protein